MHEPRHAGTRELRVFGTAVALATLFVGYWLVPRLGGWSPPAWLPWAAGSLALLALAWPPAMRPVYRAWAPVGHAVARAVNWLLLAAAYLLLIVPAGWWLRRRGKLGYRTGLDPAATSYRIEVGPERRADTDLEQPF